ncbi:MAG: cysteinyl-tRNA synthetase [Parcubacteria group bacterium Gr01-1014_72]|nr:MAG: cysteinyl-tRNA synthetase [Parcubacteria group bacterium Gr01-1014_72]
MNLFLHNTLSGKKELFTPLTEKGVRIYTCGPTVYDDAHVGNLRAYVFADTLKRALLYFGFLVKHVINITDVGHLASDADEGDDKMTKGLKREGKPLTLAAMRELADTYASRFKEDLRALNILSPNEMPHASDHIKEDISLIKILEEKECAYKTSDGMYFDTSRFREYGKLGNIDVGGLSVGARVAVNKEKKNPTDFALWKFNEKLGWDSPWGKGFPGWHVECSAMSVKYLGQPFDIHTGGTDHIPVHHQNEIAQSEAAAEKPLARFWLHGAHLTIRGGTKMAKSEGEFLRLRDLTAKGIIPEAYRYYLLTASYRTPLEWSIEAVKAAQQALLRLAHHLSVWTTESEAASSEEYKREFRERIGDDLDTPNALALVWRLIKDTSLPEGVKRAMILDFDRVLGLNLAHLAEEIKKSAEDIPAEVRELVMVREKARAEKNFSRADAIRDEIKKLGYDISDTEAGVNVRKIK